MKNIAIVVPTLNTGGGERVAANLSLEFSKYYNVYVIVHDGKNITYPYAGVLIDLELPPARTLFGKIKTMIKRINALKKIKKQYDIDYTISHLPASNYINVFSKSNDKVFTYVHSMEKGTLVNKIRMKLVGKLSDKVICVSECVRQNVIQSFKINVNKTVTIYNFCCLDNLNHSNPEKKDNNIIVTNMGRLSKPKGQWHLIKAMSLVIKKHNNVYLEIIGEGELRNELEELVKKLKLQKHVKFLGFLNKPFDRLSSGDIYVSSSLWEGLPMALVEAGMCGLPIISTDCDAGCREIIAPNTDITKKTKVIEESIYGILVPVCDKDINDITITKEEKILADAINLLIENTEKRYKYTERAKKRSIDFLPETIMNQWFEILI